MPSFSSTSALTQRCDNVASFVQMACLTRPDWTCDKADKACGQGEGLERAHGPSAESLVMTKQFKSIFHVLHLEPEATQCSTAATRAQPRRFLRQPRSAPGAEIARSEMGDVYSPASETNTSLSDCGIRHCTTVNTFTTRNVQSAFAFMMICFKEQMSCSPLQNRSITCPSLELT